MVRPFKAGEWACQDANQLPQPVSQAGSYGESPSEALQNPTQSGGETENSPLMDGRLWYLIGCWDDIPNELRERFSQMAYEATRRPSVTQAEIRAAMIRHRLSEGD